MKLVESPGPKSKANRAKARALMFSDRYYEAKAAIMKPIDDFYVLMYLRTSNAVKSAEKTATIYRFLVIAFGLGFVYTRTRTYSTLSRTLGGSVNEGIRADREDR